MFNTPVTNPATISGMIATCTNQSMQIHISPPLPDRTLDGTMRALALDRTSDEHKWRLWGGSLRVANLDDMKSQVKRMANDATERTAYATQFVLMKWTTTPSLSAEATKEAEAKLRGWCPDGFVHSQLLEAYMGNSKWQGSIFQNAEHRTVIVAGTFDLVSFHQIQSCIPKLMPWAFENAPLTETELELMRSLVQRTSDAYEAACRKIANNDKLRELYIHNQLNGFETQIYRAQLERLRDDALPSRMQKISELRDRVRSLYREIDELNITASGLQAKLSSTGDNDSELEEFFQTHKTFTLVRAHGSTVEFTVEAFTDMNDEDDADCCLQRLDWCLLEEFSSDVQERAQLRDLLRACWCEHTVRMRMCSNYTMDIVGRTMDCQSGYEYPDEVAARSIPNPHIDVHSCMGGYEKLFSQYLDTGNFVGAMEQAAPSCYSLNFSESLTMAPFGEMLRQLYRSPDGGPRAFVLPDGRNLTLKEAMEWVSAEKTEVAEVAKAEQPEDSDSLEF